MCVVWWKCFLGDWLIIKESVSTDGVVHHMIIIWIHGSEVVSIVSSETTYPTMHLPPYPTIYHIGTKKCTFLFQNGAFWDIGQVHCGICETDLLSQVQSNTFITWSFFFQTIHNIRPIACPRGGGMGVSFMNAWYVLYLLPLACCLWCHIVITGLNCIQVYNSPNPSSSSSLVPNY